MSSSLLVHLRSVLNNAAEPLAGVTWRRMFGCDTAFVRDQIFGLIWKHGRIGLRLPDAEAAAELLGQPGADPWAPGDKPMQHWVLVPEELHDDEEELARWVRRAHTLALAAPPKPDKKPKAAAQAKPAARPPAKAKPAAKTRPAAQPATKAKSATRTRLAPSREASPR